MRIFFDAVNGELAPRVTHLHRCTVRTRFAHTAAGIELHERESPWGFDNVKWGYGGVVFTTTFSITSKSLRNLERAKGFEPSTPTLAKAVILLAVSNNDLPLLTVNNLKSLIFLGINGYIELSSL